MRLDQTGGVDAVDALGEGVSDIPPIDQFGHPAQQGMLTGDGAGGEHGSGEHQFPVNRNGLPLEWSDIQIHRNVDARELTFGSQSRGHLWDIGGALVQTGYMGALWVSEPGPCRRPGLVVIATVMPAMTPPPTTEH